MRSLFMHRFPAAEHGRENAWQMAAGTEKRHSAKDGGVSERGMSVLEYWFHLKGVVYDNNS